MKNLFLLRKSDHSRCKTILLPLFMLTVMMIAPQMALSANITVTNSADSIAGSLRDAIAKAVDGDTITFDTSLSGQTITLTSTLNLGNSITIDGSGLASHLKISGDNLYRVFKIVSGNVTLHHLDIINGKISTDDFGGGGIANYSTLTVNNCNFFNNTAIDGDSGGSGGGICSYNGILTVNNCTFSSNSAFIGGGVAIFSTSTISNSTFFNNAASGFIGGGGSIYNAGGSLIVSNSTFSGNSSNDHNGSIYNSGGELTLRNSILANSTNGVDCYNDSGTVNVTNSLIESDGSGDNACGIGIGNIIGVDPMLGALANNGGSTHTFALSAGSPAINAGDDATCVSPAQNGISRPQGAHCDMGAFEYPTPAPTGLTATAASQTQINLRWTDNSSSTAVFTIYRGINMLTTTAAGVTSYSDTGLVCGTTYNYEVKAANAGGDSSGVTASATTQACAVPIAAGVNIVSISNVKATTALVTGTASGDGIGERGFFWWNDETYWGPNASGLIPAGYGAGDFSLILSKLPMSTQLYVRAYVKIDGQLITSDNKISITTTGPVAPTVITKPDFMVNGNSLSAKGEITDEGSAPLTVFGFVYATHEHPTNTDNAFTFQLGKPFEGTVANLAAGKYYFRAYAHNSNTDSDKNTQPESLSYGQEFSFTIGDTGSDIPGDLNGDGKINLSDVITALKILDNISFDNLNLKADVNGDGKIGHEEAIFVLQKLVELR